MIKSLQTLHKSVSSNILLISIYNTLYTSIMKVPSLKTQEPFLQNMQSPEPIMVLFLLDNHDYSSAMDPVPRKCFSLDLELRTGVSVVRSLVIHIFLEDWVRRNPPWNMDLSRSNSSPWISLSLLLGSTCSTELDKTNPRSQTWKVWILG